MTDKELKDFLISHYPVEDEKCDWKEMKITNLLSYLRIHNVIMVNEKKKWVLVK